MQSDRMQLRYPLNIDSAKSSLVLSTYEERIRLSGFPADMGVQLVRAANTGRSISELAALMPEFGEGLKELAEALHREGLATIDGPIYYTGNDMTALLKRYYAAWNQVLFSKGLWVSLMEGKANESVVDGWLIESYHFIRGANARLCYASAFAQDQRVRAILAEHYTEEYNHYSFFAESLRRRNINVDLVDSIGPLPSTLAVLNMARRAARTDVLAYVACSGLLESTGSDAGRAREFYNSVAKHFDKDGTRFVDPMLRHIDLDEEFEHGDVMASVFDGIPYILAERADRIIEVAALFKETLEYWFADIERFYASRDAKKLKIGRPYMSNPVK